MAQTLLIFVHPALEKSRINRVLLDRAHQVDGVHVNDLYECYPDFLINAEAEKSLLEAHDSIIFQFPMYWYSSPALLKEWFDIVLQYGWAYGHNADALVGKKVRFAVSTGAPSEAYTKEGHNGFTMEEFLKPIFKTCELCGMQVGEPFYIHGAMHLAGAALESVVSKYETWLLEG